jgi:type VI secretion system secreted protein VgrG
MRVTAIDGQTQFRPPRLAAEPLVSGVQTARVVGPSGQEIWTDEFGRVKVQFHWDREGKRDASSSCWIRVAQIWAGPGFGGLHIPRIGQEVVVEFVNGRLDNPLIIGCVYNDANKPPYTLPDNATQSGIKSHSSLKGGPEQYNELRFEDKKDAEEIVLRAERDFKTTVLHDSQTTVSNDMTVAVKEGLYATTVSEGVMTIEVPKNDYKLSAKQVFALADQVLQLDIGACQIAMNPTSITIKAAGSKIVLDASGVTVNGLMIKLNA